MEKMYHKHAEVRAVKLRCPSQNISSIITFRVIFFVSDGRYGFKRFSGDSGTLVDCSKDISVRLDRLLSKSGIANPRNVNEIGTANIPLYSLKQRPSLPMVSANIRHAKPTLSLHVRDCMCIKF